MADIIITATNVVATGANTIADCTAGGALLAGEVVYLESASNTVKLADCNSGTAEARSVYGIALNGAAVNQPVKVLRGGSTLTLGGTLTPGVAYYLSPNPGKVCPVADIVTGCYPTVLGIATSATAFKFAPIEAGVAL